MEQTVQIHPSVFNHEVAFCESGLGKIHVELKDGFGERVVTLRQADEFRYADGWGVRIIDSLRKVIGGEAPITCCNRKTLEFYHQILSLSEAGKLTKRSYIDVLSIFTPAMIDLEAFQGDWLAVNLVRSLVFASGINYARETIFEEIRVQASSDAEFRKRIGQFLDVQIFEARLIFEEGHPLLMQSDLSTIEELSYAIPWIYSWQFYDNARLGSEENCQNGTERNFWRQLDERMVKTLKQWRTAFFETEQAVGIRHGTFPIERVVGIPGVGKTETTRSLINAEGDGSVVMYLEGGNYIRPNWPQRSSHLFQLELLELEMEKKGADMERLRYLHREHEKAYYLYRDIANQELHLDWIESFLLRASDGTPCRFFIESMPFLPLVAELGCFDVHPRIADLPVMSEWGTSPWINPYEFYPLGDEELALKEPLSIGTSIRYALVSSLKVHAVFRYMYGPTVLIDAPLDVCKERIEKSTQGREQRVRLKDLDYWLSWRFIYLTLADTFPSIGVVHSAVIDESRERGYRMLSASQVAVLSASVLTLLKLRMISSDAEIPDVEILHQLIRLKERVMRL
ncbi:hypothetical protein JW766_00960 [Candidatus Dojkabacteria bacterium]|nr:hypothetical protein [Candidatus Dojkabacteria bacterium]